jgi:sugar phosphate isomerase/epimerase
MELGVCTDAELVIGLPDAPFDYVEVNVVKLLQPEASDDEFAAAAALVRGCPRPILSANCFLPSDLKVVGPDVDLERLERYADVAFTRARSLGIQTIVFGSNHSRNIPDGWPPAVAFEQLLTLLRRLGPLAERAGITLVLEPLNRTECNLVNTVLEGAVAIARVDHPHVRLLVDFYHMSCNGEPPEDIVKVGPWIAHAHLAEKQERAAPGTHGEDFRPYLRALRAAGYSGRLSMEVWWKDVVAQAPPAAENLRQQLVDAGY